MNKNNLRQNMGNNWTELDRGYVWHPYSAMGSDLPVG